MEHEFVPGKRRCRNCDVKWGYRNDFPCCGDFARVPPVDVEPAPEPPQTWHLNVWTTVNGVRVTASTKELVDERVSALQVGDGVLTLGVPFGGDPIPLDFIQVQMALRMREAIVDIRARVGAAEETE